MRRAFVISFLINHKSSSAARRCSCNEKSSFHCRLVSVNRSAYTHRNNRKITGTAGVIRGAGLMFYGEAAI